ncbi:uncharacterized protein LOC120426908 [Culex pipiens pallens]|uniref:uncharacterized protein LOC120426908 n=1 Tax=Culex pipiens pallens TaxID=42434 RepID=UPI001954E7DE|nr:uncharacterized protein LOC120426908 [Culex pipiens pallens]
MEGLFLKLSGTPNKLSGVGDTEWVTVGDWTYVRSDGNLLSFKNEPGGKFALETKYEKVFEMPLYYRFFPWTVCHLKNSAKILVVRDEEGMSAYELSGNSKGAKRAIVMDQVVNQKFDEDSTEDSVELVSLLQTDGIVVKIFELGVNQMYKLNLATDRNALIEVGSVDENYLVLASGPSEYHFFRMEKGKLLGYTMESNLSVKKATVGDFAGGKIIANVSKVYVTKLGSSKAYLFASELGLHVYKLDGKNLKFVCLNQEFSTNEGWTEDHWKTVKLVESSNISYLVFTGPKGVGIIKITENCENLTIIDADLPIEQKHGTVLAINPSSGDKLELLVLNGNAVESFAVKVETPIKSEQVTENPISALDYGSMVKLDSDIQKQVTNQPPVKPSLWLGETLDTASIADGVDRTTGQLSFTLPIIDLRSKFGVPIRHTFYFNQPEDGTGVDPGVLGKYWSRSMDFIYVDRKDTVFEDEFEYFLVSGGTKVKLEWVRSDGGKEVFKFEDTVMKYHKNGDSGKWEVITKDLVCWYGESESSIRWTLGWPNWNGKGTDEGSVLKRPLEWHLSSAKSAVGDSVVQYEYKSEVVTVKDKVHYTKDIVLKTIEDKAEGISINFSYKTVKRSDANISTKDQSKCRVVFEDSHLLTGFDIETDNHVQNITISYQNEQFLTKISHNSKDVISFEYNNLKVTKATLPSGETITYTYKDIIMSKDSLTQKFQDTSILFTGPSYTIVSHVQNNKTIEMQLLDINASQEMSKKQTLSVSLNDDISNLNILAQQNYFIVNAKTKDINTLTIFMKNLNVDSWSLKETQKHQQFVNLMAKDDHWMLLTKNSQNFLLLTYNKLNDAKTGFTKHESTLKTKVKSGVTFTTNGVAYFCKEGVFLLQYRNKFEEYRISSSDFTTKTLSTLDKFHIHSYPKEEAKKFENYKRDLEESFLDGITSFNNVIIVREITITGSKLEAILNVFVLDSNRKTVTERSEIIPGVIDLNQWQLELTVKPNDLPHECLFKFENTKNKWTLSVKKHTTREPNTKQFEEFFLGILKLPLDFEQFKLFHGGDSVICASHKLTFDGQSLRKVELPKKEVKIQEIDLQIAKRVWIKKDSPDSDIKLLVKNDGTQQVKSLSVSRLDHMTIKPPVYVAFKAHDKHSLVKMEKSGTTLGEVLTIQGKILKFSTERLLVTSHEQKVLITPMRAVDLNNNFKVNAIVAEKRGIYATSYIFDPKSPIITGHNVAFKKVQIIPNGDFSYGSFEQVTNFFDRSRTVNVLDSMNKTVVEDYKGSPEERDEPGTVNGTFVLYDKYGRNVISDFRPYAIDSQQVDFVGFERYENLKSRKWNIDESKIRRNKFSGTGKSFYRLDSKDLQGSYTLKDFQQAHIISSWIRTEKGLKINSETDILTVQVGSKPIKAHVRDQINDWFHIEVLISPDNSAKSNQKIVITFKKGSHSFVEIDHVRLSPLDFSFRAIIFDEFRNNPIAVLRHNGRTVQYLYDDYGRKIGEVDERGSVTKLVIYSKQPAQNDVSSIVNLQPVSGFVESMSPYTVGLIWDFKGNWSFSPKRASIGSGSGTMKYKQSLTDCSNIGVRLMINRAQGGTLKIKFSSSDPGIDVSSLMSENYGEIAVARYKKFFSVWIDGHLKKEELNQWNQSKELSIEVSGKVDLSDIVVMKDVDLMIEYNNAKGQPVQQISVEDDDHITMRGFVYDAVQRESVETVWTRHRIDVLRGKVLEYKPDYVELKSGKVLGSIVTSTKSVYQDYPFTMISYVACPLTIRQKIGLPGKENNIDSNRAVTYSRSTSNNFLMVLFPAMDGFRYEEQHLPNGANNTQVYDNRDRKVAEYVSVPKYDNILTTYQYDEAGNVVEVLRPNFHEVVNTKAKAQKFENFLKQLDASGKVSRTKQREHKEYNTFRQLTLKVTPDAGLYRFLYDHFRQLRFVVHYKNEKEIDKVFFHKYNPSGEMYEFGVLDSEKNLEQLKTHANDVTYPVPTTNFIRFDYGDTDTYSSYRSRKQSSLKVDKFGSTSETVYFNEDGNVLMRSYVDPVDSTRTMDVAFSYERNNVKEIIYPVKYQGKNLVVSYTHNYKGQVIAVGTRTKPHLFATIKHNPQGKAEEMLYMPDDTNKFAVTFAYNAAGNMISIDSSFIKEILDYKAGKGYNANNAGDGSILRTTFEAKWHDKCNRKQLRITIGDMLKRGLKFSIAKKCLEKLKAAKYLDDALVPIKTLRKQTESDACFSGTTFNKLSSILVGKGFPGKYGHAYDYGSHGEMTIAKYFTGSEDPSVIVQNNKITMIADASPGDVESFNIDPNGNHKLFYTGNVRHELTYKEHSNQIGTVKVGSNQKSHKFEHNSDGNVFSAEYKNIISLEYDHVVDRVSKITMKDGTTIDLGYDIRGERTFKKVTTPSGKIIETYYIRDIKARCLMDMKLVYQDRSMKKPLITLTTYIHGPLGLLGFIRNNVFYSVIADHEGSTRLVVKNGEVVAAYDYLPYGGRMRFYNSDPDGYVAFQYTGQEFDEETGLYNYHARLYDPELGRFYQTDPQEEFPSPYKYAGNSPVMNTDPDGELAFLLVCIVAAVFGAYLAAAAVSNSWNPAKWNWRSGHLWLALFGGALAGAMLPIGGAATFSTFASIGGVVFATAATATIVLAGAYLGMAGAANDFNPANWDFTSPALYSGMLNGASLAVNIPSGVVGVSRTMATFTTAKTMYGAAIVGGSLLFGYGSAVFANNMTWNPAKWDWNARTVFALFEGGTTILMATSAFVKRGPQKALLPKKPASISTAPTKRWVKKFKHSECRFDAYNDGIGDELGKLRYQQVMTGVKGKMGPVKPPPGMTKEFIAGLPTVKTLGATAVVSAIMLSEDLSKFKVYFTRLESNSTNVTETSTTPKQFLRGKRFADFNPASPSSGTRMFDNIKKFFQFRTDFLTDDKLNKESPSTDVTEHTKRPTPKPIKIHSLTNCIAMNPDRSFYECFQSTAKVLLFAQNPSLEPGSGPERIDRCVPLHWHGQPSVGCQGQQFGFIYTPYEATKMFSFLDGWLMLARVGLQVVENWRQVEEKMERVCWDEEDVGKYYGQLGEIEEILNRNKRGPFKWAKFQLEEMRTDLEEFKSRRSITALAKMVFEEKLAALRDDLIEQISCSS